MKTEGHASGRLPGGLVANAVQPSREADRCYQDDGGQLGRFLRTATVSDPSCRVQSRELFEAYVAWCAFAGETGRSAIWFSNSMVRDGWKKIHSNYRYWLGLRLAYEPEAFAPRCSANTGQPSRAVWAKGARDGRGQRLSAAARTLRATAGQIVAPPWAESGRCTIEDLINWAYGPQRVEASPVSGLCQIEAEAAGYAWQSASTDGVAAIGRIGEVGCRIDISGPGRDVVHPIAELVAHVVSIHADGEIVREWARLGTRPGGWGSRPRFAPAMLKADGEAEWIYDERHLPKRTGQHCPLIQFNSVEAVAAARRMYVRWFDAMADLYLDVSAYAGLPFELSPVRARRVPWLAREGG